MSVIAESHDESKTAAKIGDVFRLFCVFGFAGEVRNSISNTFQLKIIQSQKELVKELKVVIE
jgi:hypothetical protein